MLGCSRQGRVIRRARPDENYRTHGRSSRRTSQGPSPPEPPERVANSRSISETPASSFSSSSFLIENFDLSILEITFSKHHVDRFVVDTIDSSQNDISRSGNCYLHD